MISYYSLNVMFIPTDKCNCHPSKKSLFTAEGDNQRKQLDTRQRSMDHGEPSAKAFIYTIAPESQKHGGRRMEVV